MKGHVEILPDPAALARHVAEWITSAALAVKDTFRISLSGGSTPKALYELLASDQFRLRFPWHLVSWYWGDERFVPYDHPDSNYRMTRKAMLDKAPVPPQNIHPVPVDGSVEDAARRYETLLKKTYGAIEFGHRLVDHGCDWVRTGCFPRCALALAVTWRNNKVKQHEYWQWIRCFRV
jgi:6-phosphogluconolactonase